MESSEPPEMIILVTGAFGLLGQRVVQLLAGNLPACRLIVVGRDDRRRESLWRDLSVESVRGDLRDEQLWAALPKTITHVIHLAAFIPWRAEEKSRASVVRDNLLPLFNLLEYTARWPRLRQIIYSSSVSVYAPSREALTEDSAAEPATFYGAAKLAGEKLLRPLEALGIKAVSLRLSSLYARGQYEGTVLPMMINRARAGQDLLVFGEGTRTQDFLHCDDAARAVLAAFQKEAHGVYNIGAGMSVSMGELAGTVSRVFADGAARITFQPEKADNDPGLKLDINRARRELNFQPAISLESGLRQLKQEMETVGREGGAAPLDLPAN